MCDAWVKWKKVFSMERITEHILSFQRFQNQSSEYDSEEESSVLQSSLDEYEEGETNEEYQQQEEKQLYEKWKKS